MLWDPRSLGYVLILLPSNVTPLTPSEEQRGEAPSNDPIVDPDRAEGAHTPLPANQGLPPPIADVRLHPDRETGLGMSSLVWCFGRLTERLQRPIRWLHSRSISLDIELRNPLKFDLTSRRFSAL